eukprot:267724-Chlamydomonas_euryale.AAC.1
MAVHLFLNPSGKLVNQPRNPLYYQKGFRRSKVRCRVARYGPYPPPLAVRTLRYGTHDDGSTGGRAGGAGGGG